MEEAFLQLIGCAEEENMVPFFKCSMFSPAHISLSIYCGSKWNVALANKRLTLELRSW